VSIEINYNYVENVLFYLDSNLNPETLNIKKNQEKNSIFQDDEFKYYFKINNTELYDKVKEELFDLAHRSTGRKTGWLLTSLLLSFITYTFLRSLKK